MTRYNPRVFKVSFLTEKLHKGQKKRELCFESEVGLYHWDSCITVVAMVGSCPAVWKLDAGFVFFLHVQTEKEHLFIVNLLPFFCSCFTETTTNTEFSRFRPAERQWKTGAWFYGGSKFLGRKISLVKLQHDFLLFFFFSLKGHFTGKLMLQQ